MTEPTDTTTTINAPMRTREFQCRLHRFADLSPVEAFLGELAGKPPARVVKLPRAPGAREVRWAHLLCGEVVMLAAASTGSDDDTVSIGELVELKAEQPRPATELPALRAQAQRLQRELGT